MVTNNGLPEAFALREHDGTLTQVMEPCYQCMAPQYLGDTWFGEGEIIVTGICPNEHLRPLNRAAGLNYDRWLDSLPGAGIKVNIEDVVEAAERLRNEPSVKDMSHDQLSSFVTKLAQKLHQQRESAHGLVVPPVAGNESRVARSSAPPMPNVRFTDPHRGSPLDRQRVLHEPQRGAPPASRLTPQPAGT